MRAATYLSFVLAAALGASAVAAEELVWHEDLAAAQAEAQKNGGLILVDLYADWCGWCKQLEREVFTSEEFRALSKDYALLRVDTEDRAEGSALQRRYEADELPTILVLTPDMGMVGRIKGFAPKEIYIGRIEAEVERYREVIAAADASTESTDPMVRLALARELLERQEGTRAAKLFAELISVESFSAAERARIAYRLADSQRITGSFERALSSLAQARALASGQNDTRLVEICDLLLIRIASEKGDCPETRSAAETFLASYPKSEYRRIASGALATLELGEQACT